MLSYGLVLALFLLGPGFATYAGVFIGFQGGKFQSAPPPPNSIFSLAVVSMSALLWHGLWATLLAIDDAVCAGARACFALPFDPDVYVSVVAAAGRPSPQASGPEVAGFLLTCLGLSAAAFAAGVGFVRLPAVADALRRSTYGLYAGLVEEASRQRGRAADPYVTAYVITDLQRDGNFVGYVGVLENLQVGADKQIAGIALIECNTFLLHLGRTVRRSSDLRTEPLDRIVISGARIQNVAFTVLD